MASGMFTKQATFLTAKYLNDVNDSTLQGAVNSIPSGAPTPAWVQDLPGDRICIDDFTALALSDTAIGTLYGGIYEYVLYASVDTAAAALGQAAFFKSADIGATTTALVYEVSSDAQPTTAIPTYFAGVFISAPTKGNFCWIQIAGIATCLFDSSLTATAAGNWVSVKVSSSVASCFDCGAVVGVVTLSALVGTAVGLPATSTASKVAMWRGFGRI